MKSLLIYTIAILIPAAAFAQSPTPTRPQRIAPTAKPTPKRPTPQPVKRSTQQRMAPKLVSEKPSQNITLSWQGSLAGSFEIDLELTGCGPEFRADLAVPDKDGSDAPPAILSVNSVVIASGDQYRVNFSVGARVAIKTSRTTAPGPAVSHNYEFRDVMLTGEVLLSPGKSVAVSKAQGKTLTLSLSEAE